MFKLFTSSLKVISWAVLQNTAWLLYTSPKHIAKKEKGIKNEIQGKRNMKGINTFPSKEMTAKINFLSKTQEARQKRRNNHRNKSKQDRYAERIRASQILLLTFLMRQNVK